MSKRVIPLELIPDVVRGRSCPQLIRFSDGRKYVVKFKNNPQGNRALFSEYVVGKIAERLDLAVPRFKVIKISDEFISANPILIQSQFKKGYQFASEYMEDSRTLKWFRPRPTKKEIVNRQDAAGIIVFDHWLGNTDRKGENMLLQPCANGFRLFTIDHANCFYAKAPGFVFKPLEPMYNSSYEWFCSLLDGKEQLASFVEKVHALPESEIYDAIRSVPEQWDIDNQVKEDLAEHLVKIRKILPIVIEEFRRKYVGT